MDVEARNEDSLSREESLQLLAGAVVGRVVFTSRALPAVQPVGFLFVDGAVVIGTDPLLTTAVQDSVVAFEADHFDPTSLAGWSVTITGRASEVRGNGMMQWLRDSWPLGEWQRFMRIPCELVSGQRLGPPTGERRLPRRSTGAVAIST